MQPPPYLDVAGRVNYLYAREYFDQGSITDADAARLATVNFHYFLGYARNYRALTGRNQIALGSRRPVDVFNLIDLDAEVSTLLHSALRSVEWRLRALTVEGYCAKFEARGTYLDVDGYLNTGDGERERMLASLLTHIYRHDEPYVAEFLAAAAAKKGCQKPRRYEHAQHETCLSLAEGLPLWAVVDSFSLGLLGQFLMTCDASSASPVWKSVAQELNIGAQVFGSSLRSLAYVRNSVAHHARLWMRPTADSPRKPRKYEKKLRDTHPKSMYWAFLNIATFMQPREAATFVTQLDSLTQRHDIYWHGITRVH